MRKMTLLVLPLFLIGSAFGGYPLELRPVVSGLTHPVFLTHAGDGSGRLFIVERVGRIRIVRDGDLLELPFLNISDRVSTNGEMGLLGLAFHPDFEENRRFFVNYATNIGGSRTVVAEFRASEGDPDVAEEEETILFELAQPASNHNAGMIAFGPDGKLYIATGDGGGSGDSFGNGQNPGTLHAKILRIDVDNGDPFAIPADNPFVGDPEFRPETWAWGFRNPWRFSFDRLNGRLFVADVGQNLHEEVDMVERAGNYGWSIMEASSCFSPPSGCDTTGLQLPIHEYGRNQGASVTGGYVYRGVQQTEFRGSYIFGDFISRRIWALTEQENGEWERRLLLDTSLALASFGEDEEGELYALDLNGGGVFLLQFGQQQVFAHLGDGTSPVGILKSAVVLVNNSHQPVSGRLEFFRSQGGPLEVTIEGVTGSSFDFELPARGSRIFETAGVSQPLITGWARALSGGTVEGSVLFILEDEAGNPVREAGIAASPAGLDFTAFVSRSQIRGTGTGLAVANPTSETVTYTVQILDAEQQMVAESRRQLAAGHQEAFFIGELEGVPPSFGGTLQMQSDALIHVTLLRTSQGIHSSSLPVATGQ